MSAVVETLESDLAAVNPTAVRAYLLARGWQQVEAPGDRPWSLWQAPAGEQAEPEEALMPHNPQLRDYARRLRELVNTLETVEHRAPQFIARDIRLAGFDIVRVRLQGEERAYDGILPLDDAVEAVSRTRDLLLAGACAAVAPRMYFPSRKPARATEYMKRVRLGQTEPGSFIFNVLSPVAPELRTDQAGAELVDEPFERKVVTTLRDALLATTAAAVQAGATQRLEPFETAVARGVSANLCEALAGLSLGRNTDRDVEIAFAWAGTRSHSPEPTRLSILPTTATLIREAAQDLKAKSPRELFEVTGPVVNANRAPGAPIGEVTVHAAVDEGFRLVRFEANESDFALATRALEERKLLSATGTLVKEGRSYLLRDATQFAVRDVGDPLDL